MFLIELKLLLLTKAMKIYFENQPYKHLVKKGLKHIPTTKVTVCLKCYLLMSNLRLKCKYSSSRFEGDLPVDYHFNLHVFI